MSPHHLDIWTLCTKLQSVIQIIILDRPGLARYGALAILKDANSILWTQTPHQPELGLRRGLDQNWSTVAASHSSTPQLQQLQCKTVNRNIEKHHSTAIGSDSPDHCKYPAAWASTLRLHNARSSPHLLCLQCFLQLEFPGCSSLLEPLQLAMQVVETRLDILGGKVPAANHQLGCVGHRLDERFVSHYLGLQGLGNRR